MEEYDEDSFRYCYSRDYYDKEYFTGSYKDNVINYLKTHYDSEISEDGVKSNVIGYYNDFDPSYYPPIDYMIEANYKDDIYFKCYKNYGGEYLFCNNVTIKPMPFVAPKRSWFENLSIQDIDSYMHDRGDTLISQKQMSLNQALYIKCKNGHIYRRTFLSYFYGQRCPICTNAKRCMKPFTMDEVKNICSEFNIKVLSEKYYNVETLMKFECENKHIFTSTFVKIQQNSGKCPVCFPNNCGFSKKEKEVFEFVCLKTNTVVSPNKRGIIVNPETNRDLELDIWLPKLKKAIEFNGDYWHSFAKTKHKDELKEKLCKDCGIQLMQITEHDWDKHKIKTKRAILEFLKDGK